MSPQYLSPSWPPFIVGEDSYDLSHLNEEVLEVLDSSKVRRGVLVTYSDHCFTRDPLDEEDLAPSFPNCSRSDGRFCAERYALSFDLPKIIRETAEGGVVWNTDGDHYAVVRLNIGGESREYAVLFSLDRLKGFKNIHLHLRVRSAHPRNDDPIATFGSVRFAHLVRLRVANQRPPKLFDKKRKRPNKSRK